MKVRASTQRHGLNVKQALAAQMQAEGKPEEDILLVCFGEAKTPEEKKKQKAKLRSWRASKGFQDYYTDTVRMMLGPLYSKAMSKIGEQLDSDNAWIAQNAAREVLSRYGEAILGAEEKAVTVRIEGMPTLGVPETDDAGLPDGTNVVMLPDSDEDVM